MVASDQKGGIRRFFKLVLYLTVTRSQLLLGRVQVPLSGHLWGVGCIKGKYVLEAASPLRWSGASARHPCRPVLLPAHFLSRTFTEDQNACISGVPFVAVCLLRLLGLLPCSQPCIGHFAWREV